jgi:hypothetical protein
MKIGEVSFKLTAGQEADAVVAAVSSRYPDVRIVRYPAYIAIERPERLKVEIPLVGEAMGTDYDVTKFLVIMSSYSGSITVHDDSVELVNDEGRDGVKPN